MKPNSVYFCETCERTVNTWHHTEFKGGGSAHKPSHSGAAASLSDFIADWRAASYAVYARGCADTLRDQVLWVGTVCLDRGSHDASS